MNRRERVTVRRDARGGSTTSRGICFSRPVTYCDAVGVVTVTLYRPVGQKELDLIEASGWTGFPPRLEWQPIPSELRAPRCRRSSAARVLDTCGGVESVQRCDRRSNRSDCRVPRTAARTRSSDPSITAPIGCVCWRWSRDNDGVPGSARVLTVLAIALLCACCTSDSPATSPHSRSVSANSLPPRPGAEPTVTADPATGLHDGQTVQVRVQGFYPFDRVHLSECANGRVVTEIGCGAQLAEEPFVDTDDHGGGSRSFTLTASASTASLNSDTTSLCGADCVLVAVGTSGLTYTPIAFGP